MRVFVVLDKTVSTTRILRLPGEGQEVIYAADLIEHLRVLQIMSQRLDK